MPESPSLNIIFAGTPEFAAKHLDALVNSHHNVCAVYTQPDRPAGRGKKLTPSDVKVRAEKYGLPVFQPASLKSTEAQAELKALNGDIMVVVAYGLLLPKAVLEIPKYGCINVHGSILPKWRGAAPIQRAIEAGDKLSGVTIMQMDVGLDTGDMLLKAECPITLNDTTTGLHDRLCDIGPPALLETLELIATGNAKPEQQDDSQSTYAKKIEKSEGLIDWSEDAYLIDRKIRAFNPFPICYTSFKNDRLRIHSASIVDWPLSEQLSAGAMIIHSDKLIVKCGKYSLAIDKLQLPGKKTMSAADFINGFGELFLGSSSYVQLGDV